MVDIQTWFSIQQLYADYAAAVDSVRVAETLTVVLGDSLYLVKPRYMTLRQLRALGLERVR